MNEVTTLFLAWAAGLGLGAAFFGGLWWTVGRALASARPARWILWSSMVRVALALGVFYVVSGGDAGRLALCVLGFVMARFGATRRARGGGEHVPQL